MSMVVAMLCQLVQSRHLVSAILFCLVTTINFTCFCNVRTLIMETFFSVDVVKEITYEDKENMVRLACHSVCSTEHYYICTRLLFRTNC
jgi:hypothetical protein